MGDVYLEINIRSQLLLKNMRHILDIYLQLISTKILDDKGYHSHFSKEKWKLTKSSLVVESGKKLKMLHMM